MARIEIDRKYCKSCGLCMGVCPFHLITWSKEAGETGYWVEQINAEKCTGCKQCAIMCPDSAISVFK